MTTFIPPEAGDGRELRIASFDGVLIAGTLTVSPTDTTLIITVHGSFPQNRDGDLDDTQVWMFPSGVPKRGLFLEAARQLAPLGVGSYRYDKRASGKSQGVYEEADIECYAKDLISVFASLRRLYPELKIGVVGQSEGAITALRAHELGLQPDFYILQGPALDPMVVWMAFQETRAAAPFLKDPEGPLARKLPYLTALYLSYFRGDFKQKMLETSDPYYTFRLGDWKGTTCLRRYRQYKLNGREVLKSVACPVALIVGTLDQNVIPETVREIEAAKKVGLYPNVSTYVLEGLEHSFREMLPGETFVEVMAKKASPLYGEALKDFIQNHVE